MTLKIHGLHASFIKLQIWKVLGHLKLPCYDAQFITCVLQNVCTDVYFGSSLLSSVCRFFRFAFWCKMHEIHYFSTLFSEDLKFLDQKFWRKNFKSSENDVKNSWTSCIFPQNANLKNFRLSSQILGKKRWKFTDNLLPSFLY